MTVTSLIDTHTHLDTAAFSADRSSVWDAAQRSGVVSALLVGVSPEGWDETVRVARELPSVGVALGVHPQVVPTLGREALSHALCQLPDRLRQCHATALGECGLDAPTGSIDMQVDALRAQLDIARQLSLPISLHVFGAHARALVILREFAPLASGGAVHSYSGSAELVRDYLKMGLSIGFAGAITRSNARRPLAAARVVPRDHLLIETDAPYQAASGATGQVHGCARGEPIDLHLVLRALALARNEDVEELGAITTANALRVFAGLRAVASQKPTYSISDLSRRT